MNPGQSARATIDMRLDVPAPEGVLTDDRGRARRFSGWIELAAAIEDWRTTEHPIQEPKENNHA